MSTPLISVCMIVKDEEAVLERCLRSISEHIEEIIIVDTGSTDATKSIALKYTDKVYDFKWINDFSAARNEALKYATGKFIVVLDADEYMDETNLTILKQQLEATTPQANTIYALTVVNVADGNKPSTEDPILRAFANGFGIRYVRPIHEQPAPVRGNSSLSYLPVRIMHSGYTEATVIAKNKHERNLNIFHTMQEEKQFSPYDECMLGRQLLMMGRKEEALPHLLRGLREGNENAEWYRHNVVSTIELYVSLNRFIEAYEVYQQSLRRYRDYPDVQCIYAVILQQLGFWDKAKETFEQANALAEERATQGLTVALYSTEFVFQRSLWQLATIYEREQRYAEAVPCVLKLVQANPRDVQAFAKLIELLALLDKPANIIRFLNRQFQADSDEYNQAMVGKISLSLYQYELAAYYCERTLWGSAYSTGDRLRYGLLMKRPEIVEQVLTLIPEDELDNVAATLVATGILCWNRQDWLPRLYSYTDLYELIRTLTAEPQISPPEEKEQLAITLLKELYMLRQWDAYELLLGHYDSARTVNALVGFFFTKHELSTATQYCQHLLDNETLNVSNYATLAFNQHKQGYTDDAVALWEQAIDRFPTETSLYIAYMTATNDIETRRAVRQALLAIAPEYERVRLIYE
ncbi:glycosyltransferase [Cohnella soli]|uniref:Glycosyltransferase n=1 Tax=Cohnella soli TaxID=425005 RepID=A0ABW0HLA3_9BACL